MGDVHNPHFRIRCSMTLLMDKVSSSEVSERFGYFYDEAMTRPIAVERNGAARVVMFPAAEYERLIRFDQIAITPQELSDEAFRSIRRARSRPEAVELDKLLD